MDKIRWKHRLLGTLLFVIYLAGLSYFLFFAEALGRQGRSSANLRYNIVLFREIWRFWHYRHILGYRAFILNTFGNVCALRLFFADCERKATQLFPQPDCGDVVFGAH